MDIATEDLKQICITLVRVAKFKFNISLKWYIQIRTKITLYIEFEGKRKKKIKIIHIILSISFTKLGHRNTNSKPSLNCQSKRPLINIKG